MNAQSSLSQVKSQNEAVETAAEAKSSRKADSAFRTISEVADELDVQQHVLRFWETKFSQIRPLKRGGGRRYYRPEDVELLKTIHHLLYTEGYTIKGVQKMLKEQGKNKVVAATQGTASPVPAQQRVAPVVSAASGSISVQNREFLEEVLSELNALRDLVEKE